MSDDEVQKISRREIPRISRRHAMRTIGFGAAALAAAPLLAACGSSKKSTTSPTIAPAGSTATTTGTGAPATTVAPASGPAGPVADIAKFLGTIDPAHAGKGMTVAMGSVLALSGPGSFYGQVMSKGVNLAIKHIAALGGPTINVSFKDHKSGDPTAGVNAMQELSAAKVPIVLASYVDDLGAMFAASAQDEILSLDGGGGTGLFGNSKPYFYGMRADTPTDPFPGVVKYIKAKLPNVKKVAYQGWDLGSENKPIFADFKSQLIAGGLTPGTIQVSTVGATDYSTNIQALKSDKPDLIFVSLYGLDPGYFMKQYVTSGIGVPIIGYEYTPDAAKTAGSAYDDYMFAFDYFDAAAPSNGWGDIFVSEFTKAYGEQPDFYAANYYEDTFAVWDLFRRVLMAGGDPAKGSSWLTALEANPSFKSVYGGNTTTAGILALDPSTHTPIKRPMGIFKYTSTGGTPLAFFDIDGADFQLA